MIAELGSRLGVQLERCPLVLDKARVILDAASPDRGVLVEAYAHLGAIKGGQPKKVLTDAFKLAFVGRVLGGNPRLILLFCDEEAAATFRTGRGWAAAALRHFGIECEVVPISETSRTRLAAAQQRQKR